MKLADLFEVHNGIVSSKLSVLPKSVPGAIPYLRPSCTQQGTISGWVIKKEVDSRVVFPAGSLFVSTNGEGSHTFSYVSSFEFCCNSDVSVLVPKRKMSLNEKVYFARCISSNRFRFSYGRKPKGERLKRIELPVKAPEWISGEIDNTGWVSLERLCSKEFRAPALKTRESLSLVPLEEIFSVRYGHSLSLNSLDLLEREDGGIPFVSRKMGDNGVSAYVAPVEGMEPAPSGEMSCALSGNGVLSTFFQDKPFYTGFHVACLRPLAAMTCEEALFYSSCIGANRFRYSYGRQANRTLKKLLIPDRKSLPKWVPGALLRAVKSFR